MEQLLHVPQDQEIDFFYSLIRQDPDFLQAIDQKQFAETPLHTAAGEGRTQLALEIQRLMPSFGRKLNPEGFSPVDLALQRGHTKTVRAMIRMNPELVCVQGREGITPLHYAAETDAVDMLAEFLCRCPDSIKKLTVREESAAHVAVKNGKLAAFRVLLGWLKRTDRKGVLRWRDLKGDAVLHLAASTNQPKVMELLVQEVCVNDENSEGLTALDIVMKLPSQVNGRALQILHRNRAKRGSSIRDLQFTTIADYYSSKISFIEKTIIFAEYLDMGMPSKMRNAVLVVAVLITTTTYQAVHSPPGGFRDDQTPVILNITSVPNNSSTTTNTTSTNITSNFGLLDVLKTQGADKGNGKVLMTKEYFLTFESVNFIAFAASIGIIFFLLPFNRYNFLLHISLFYLMVGYILAMNVTSRADTDYVSNIEVAWLYIFLFLIMPVKSLVSYGQKLRRKQFSAVNQSINETL